MISNKIKRLFVFDFDHTVIDCNSDTIIYELFPGGKLPEHLQQKAKTAPWNRFMQMVYDQFYSLGIKKDDVRRVIRSAKLTPGFRELIEKLAVANYTCIIASDSNSFFIDEILDEQKLKSVFSCVFTNPLRFEEGKLVIDPFHKHDCDRCPINICKSKAVEEFVKAGQYEQIFYAGDGSNDFCPCLKYDLFCYCRKDYSLDKLIKKHDMQAKSLCWNSGFDILQHMKSQKKI